MTELPRIVRERLKAQASGPVDVHPDADLLTAFCEHTLTGTEHQQVIAHLALCADCRDAVALSTPPQSSEAEPLRPHRESRRFRWVHWFALAASVVVVATAVLQQPRSSQPGSELEMATRERAPVTAAKPSPEPQNGKAAETFTTASSSTPAPAQAAASAEHDDRSALVKGIAEEQQPKRDESASPVPKLYGDVGERKNQANAPSQPRVGPGRAGIGTGASAGPGVVGGTRTGAFGAGQQTTPASSVASLEKERRDAPQAPPPPPARANEAAAVEDNRRPADALKSKDAEAAPAESAAGARKFERQLAVTDSDDAAGEKEAAAQAMDQEALGQKSRTQANVTGPINVETLPMKKQPAQPAAKTSKFGALAGKLKAPLRWTVSAVGLVQRSLDGGKSWQDLFIREGVRFRAVAAQDGNVWAGGDGGALFHSSDAGETWTSRPLSGDAKRLEMTPGFDILHIDINASGQVTVTTSQRQTFVSTDAGQNWNRQ
ncbi:MAG: YCF48-related protein [Terriglobales bacterium]